MNFIRDRQFYRFSAYGFLKNLRFFEPFIILYFREIGFSFLDIGILYAIREICTVLLEVPTGLVADIGGRKISMIFSMAAYIVCFLVFFFFPSYEAAAGAMVLFACGEAFRTGTHKAMILEYLRLTGQEEWKPDYYGATRAASKLGSALNALIAATLVFISGSLRYVFFAAAFPCAINMINLATYPSALNGTDVDKGLNRPGIKDTFKHFLSIFRNQDARLSIMNSAFFDGFFKVLKEYLQPVLKTMAIGLPVLTALSLDRRTAILIGLVYFVLFLAASTASRYSGKFSRRIRGVVQSINITWIVGFSMLIIAGVFYGLSVYVVTIGAYLVLFTLQNLRRPLCVTYISDKVPGRVMASGLSVESLIKTLVMTILAPVCGYIADLAGVGITIASAGVLMGLLYVPLKLTKSVQESAPVI
ncbi:MAG: MFS transporter [Candidatus Aegiribacteria sp.]|nr:MFS transporter [Candidatus Aegiribacteria sp.]